jgi:hypothetical protein
MDTSDEGGNHAVAEETGDYAAADVLDVDEEDNDTDGNADDVNDDDNEDEYAVDAADADDDEAADNDDEDMEITGGEREICFGELVCMGVSLAVDFELRIVKEKSKRSHITFANTLGDIKTIFVQFPSESVGKWVREGNTLKFALDIDPHVVQDKSVGDWRSFTAQKPASEEKTQERRKKKHDDLLSAVAAAATARDDEEQREFHRLAELLPEPIASAGEGEENENESDASEDAESGSEGAESGSEGAAAGMITVNDRLCLLYYT